MAIQSKIGIIHEEIKRIGAYSPDVFKPGLDVDWRYSDMVMQGKRTESFPFEMLHEVLKKVPDGAGEDAFWREVDATDFDALYERHTQEMLDAWEKETRFERQRLARLKKEKSTKAAAKKTKRKSK